MKAILENKFSMYLAVAAVCEKHQAIWQALPAFVTDYADWSVRVDRIRDLGQKQGAASGAASAKKALRDTMSDAALEIAGALGSCANKTKDAELAAIADVTRSIFDRARDSAVAGLARGLHTAASAKAAALVPYGVTAAKLTALDTTIKAYEGMLGKPRQARTETKTATGQLEVEFKEADALLENSLDRLVVQFKTSTPDFYHAYRAARIIVDSGGGKAKDATPPAPPANPQG